MPKARLHVAIAAALALGPLAHPAAAAEPASAGTLDADLRCFTAISFRMGDASDDVVAKYVYPFVYYAGRIDASAPGLDYQREIVALLNRPGFDEPAIERELARCEAEFKTRLDYLDTMGQKLGAEGK